MRALVQLRSTMTSEVGFSIIPSAHLLRDLEESERDVLLLLSVGLNAWMPGVDSTFTLSVLMLIATIVATSHHTKTHLINF